MKPNNIILLVNLFFYFFYNTTYTILFFSGLILFPIYLIYDLIFYKLTIDKIIHHILGLGMCIGLYINREFEEEMYSLALFEISTEISTFFLILIDYKVLTEFSKVLFVITFVYFRVYKFLIDKEQILFMTQKLYYRYFFIFVIFSVFILNLYWLTIIVRKLFKIILLKSQYNSEFYIKRLIYYTDVIFVPFFLYSFYINNFKDENLYIKYISNLFIIFISIGLIDKIKPFYNLNIVLVNFFVNLIFFNVMKIVYKIFYISLNKK